MKVLIVEDQADLVKNMKQYLELEKFVVEVAYDGEEAEALIDSEVYDVIILDLNLPKKDGMTVCREAREKGIGTPILILTARTAKDSIIEGLNIGADDYITKPFDMDELVARIRSAIRRSNKQPNPIIEVNESIAIDTNAKTVSRNNEFVKLAPKEYALLEYLAINKNKVVERTKIIEHVWGEFDSLMFSQTVDVHIAYLRKKLGKSAIKTAPGGYIISQ
jgi:DNA-binding response OmpR family regulator